jgi:hypothetical protein
MEIMVSKSAEPRAYGRRRLLAAAAVAALVVAGLLAAFLTFRDEESPPGNGGPVTTFRDPAGAWEGTYPDRFTQGRIPAPPDPGRGVTVEGIWIANFEAQPFDERTGVLSLAEVPDDGVVVVIYQRFGGPAFMPVARDSTFPISFEDLKVERGRYQGVWRTDEVHGNGEPYTIEFRMGADATAEDQKAAAEVVSSFRITPLREQTATGRHLTFYVLAPPDEYPVGSVTRFDEKTLPRTEFANRLPFYLVHVPDGFYALAWPDDFQGGYKHCDVAYEAAAREFSCPNGARWALDGSVIEKPGPAFPDDPLSVLVVRISLDDHVLVSTNVFMSDTTLDLRVTEA